MSAPQLGGAALALGGMALVAMQFMGGSAENAKVDEKAGRLKKTLTNAGLYPQPETGESRLKKRMTTGRMGVFATGDTSATLSKGTGDPM